MGEYLMLGGVNMDEINAFWGARFRVTGTVLLAHIQCDNYKPWRMFDRDVKCHLRIEKQEALWV